MRNLLRTLVLASSCFNLRKFVVSQDEYSLFQALGNPIVVKHLASRGITLKDCESIVSCSLEHWNEHEIGSWGVEIKGQIVGWAGFKHLKDEEFEVLIVLSPSHWGLGKEIFYKLVELAVKEFELSHLYVLIPETRKSFRYLRHIGFEFVSEETYNGEKFNKFVLKLTDFHKL